jgi:hypothetical protein
MNRLRIAVEMLLTEMRVPRFANSKGKRRRLSLHQRIEKMPASRLGLREQLFAVKWLGNAGSHPGQVTQDGVLDGMELMDHVLREHYASPQKAAAKLSQAINKRKGPRS